MSIVQQVFEAGVDVEVAIVGKVFHTFDPLVAASVLVPHHFLLHPRVGDAVAVGAAGVISLLAYERLVAEVRPLKGWKVGAAPAPPTAARGRRGDGLQAMRSLGTRFTQCKVVVPCAVGQLKLYRNGESHTDGFPTV